MNLQPGIITEIANDLAKELQESVDRQILFDLLVECGWTKVELPSKWLQVSGVELHKWREQNLTGQWKAHENIWIFEKEKDAEWFMLRWL